MKTVLRYALAAIVVAFLGLVAGPGVLHAKEMKSLKEAVAPAPEPVADNVMKIIQSRKELSRFADMLEETGMDKILSDSKAKLTVFAPTNEALEKLPADVAKRLKGDKGNLRRFLEYHVIANQAYSSAYFQGRIFGAVAMNGESLGLGGEVRFPKVNESKLSVLDRQAKNGVVHILETALVSQSLKESPKAAEEREMEMMRLDRERDSMRQRAQAEREKLEKSTQAEKAKEAKGEVKGAETQGNRAKEATAETVAPQTPQTPQTSEPTQPLSATQAPGATGVAAPEASATTPTPGPIAAPTQAPVAQEKTPAKSWFKGLFGGGS